MSLDDTILNILAENEAFAHSIINNCRRVREQLSCVDKKAPAGKKVKGLTPEQAQVLVMDFKARLHKKTKRS
ncbi:MAG: hypothetical protein QM791_06170 [Ferruginibacter sp.]